MDIIVLIIVCILNGRLAVKKGLPAGMWRLNTVAAWIVLEMIGMLFGIMLLGPSLTINLALIGFGSGFGGYLIIRAILEKKPDLIEDDDVNNIGVDDLRPPKQ